MTKKIFAVAFAAALVFGSLAAVSHAGNRISDKIVPLCKKITSHPKSKLTMGQCVSRYATRFNNDGPAKFCQEYWDDFKCFENQGDCVSYFRTR